MLHYRQLMFCAVVLVSADRRILTSMHIFCIGVYYFIGILLYGVFFFCSQPIVKELIYLGVIDFSSL